MSREELTRQHSEDAPDGFPGGALLHLCVVVGVFVALLAVPYAHPSMEDQRWLHRIDVEPLLRAVRFEPPPPREQLADDDTFFAEDDFGDPELPVLAAAADADVGLGGVDGDDGDGGLGDDGDAGQGDSGPGDDNADANTATDGSQPTADDPIKPPPGVAAVTADGAVGAPGADALHLPPSLWAEQPGGVFIEHVARLEPFFAALRALARGERERVRVAHRGDSHVASDWLAFTVRLGLQARFGDGGPGYMAAGSRKPQWEKVRGIARATSDGAKVYAFPGGVLSDGGFGYAGEATVLRPGQSVRYRLVPPRKGAPATQASGVTVYARAERDAVITIDVDGKPADVWQLARGEGDATRVLDVPDERHTLRIRVKKGRARVYGAAFERQRGLVWDGMGVIGARAARWRKVDAAHLANQHKQRPVDLLVLQYGGNSRLDRLSRGRYKERYAEVIAHMRADDPQRPCLLVGPSDHAAKGSRRKSDPNTVRINDWQRELADDVGCAFFDTIAFMGGEGSVHRWHQRGWVAPDRAHLTARGNRRLGEGLLRALYKGLAGAP